MCKQDCETKREAEEDKVCECVCVSDGGGAVLASWLCFRSDKMAPLSARQASTGGVGKKQKARE